VIFTIDIKAKVSDLKSKEEKTKLYSAFIAKEKSTISLTTT